MSGRSSKDSVRTCVGCRQRVERTVLLRVVAGDQGTGLRVVPDPSRRAPGRGAHLHPTVACLELALRRRAFGRAFRVGGAGFDASAVEQYLQSEHQGGRTGPPHTSTPSKTDKKMEQRLMSTR